MRILVILFTLIMFSLAAAQTEDIYPVQTRAQQHEFNHLLTQFRCLVCQNENLADSNAALAKDLRQVVYQQVLEDKSETQIKAYLQARYGDFVLFQPPVNPLTYALWFSPIILLVLGAMILHFSIRRMQRQADPGAILRPDELF